MHFADLLRRAASGDTAAQGELVAAFYPRVRAIAHRQLEQQIGRDALGLLALFSTGDVVQEAFVAALHELPRFRGESEAELVGWLAALVRNRVVDAIRHHLAQRRDRRRCVAGLDGNASPDRDLTPSQAMARREHAVIQERVLSGLDGRERALLQARLVDVAAWGDSAAHLGCPRPDAARFAFRRLQARLMLQLARAGLGSAGTAEETS
ncbi:MAG: sigma-70 family RNA polymerase sigma factor [Planctomycetota bacterium]